MDFNLKMLNLWVGLCKGDRGLPGIISANGYRQHSIEQTIRNQDGTICVPEFIAHSKKLGHTLVFEWKGGKNTVDDQLSRYQSITSQSLINVALVPKEAASSFDVVIVCEAAHAETIKLGIVKGNFDFPVISVDGLGMHRVMNDFHCQKLNEVFAPSLAIDFSSAPMCHVPVNEKSEDWEVADIVIPKVLEKMLDRQTLIKASSICPSICPLWDNMHGPARMAVQKRVCEILQQAALGEFGAFLVHRKRNNDCEVDFVHNPVDVHEGKRSGALKRLKNASRIFKERLISGRRFEPEGNLFDGFSPD